MPNHSDAITRLMNGVVKNPETGCWEFRRSMVSNGYGRIRSNGVQMLAHRFSYSALVGPIPDGFEVDHLCRNRCCINPDHLEPVTHRENTLRGESSAAQRARQTHCVHGHELTPENTVLRGSMRECRTCKKVWARNYRERRKSAA